MPIVLTFFLLEEMDDATKDLLEPYSKLPSSSEKLGRYERVFFKYYMEMHSSDKITDAFVQRCIREGVDYRIWKRNFKPEGVADFKGYLKERARNERKYVKRLTLKAILQVLIYKALYDKSYLGSKTTMRWMDMLDFICNGSVDLFGTGRERKIQNENIWLQRDSNPNPASPRQGSCSALDRSATRAWWWSVVKCLAG